MRILRLLPFLVIALHLSAAGQTGATGMTDEDREHLLVHFEMTGQVLAEEVRGLSPAQLEYRTSPDRWSIRECVSHLAVAEPDYWRDLMKDVYKRQVLEREAGRSLHERLREQLLPGRLLPAGQPAGLPAQHECSGHQDRH